MPVQHAALSFGLVEQQRQGRRDRPFRRGRDQTGQPGGADRGADAVEIIVLEGRGYVHGDSPFPIRKILPIRHDQNRQFAQVFSIPCVVRVPTPVNLMVIKRRGSFTRQDKRAPAPVFRRRRERTAMVNEINLPGDGAFLGRARSPGKSYPLVVTVRGDDVVDITSKQAPTVRDICEMDDPAGYVRSATGEAIGSVEAIAANSFEAGRVAATPYLLSPVDLQAVKASGVTFVVSLLERVIEEQARGSAAAADAIRADIATLIGHDLSKLKPGSAEAMEIKTRLIERGAWSQYLEVGIGPAAEVFTKCPPMASVGFGADVGLHPISTWNNPEPEIAVISSSTGRIVGAALGNDVNLR